MLRQIHLKNLLSFGPDSAPVPLGPLNVLIGPNGSGKSNFIDAIDLLRYTPTEMARPIRAGGGILEWLWKGTRHNDVLSLEVVVDHSVVPWPMPGRGLLSAKAPHLRHAIQFIERRSQFRIVGEVVSAYDTEGLFPTSTVDFYRYEDSRAVLSVGGQSHLQGPETIDVTRSILAQRRDPTLYPELTALAENYPAIHIYGEWALGRSTLVRQPQRTDLPDSQLLPDCSNLGLVLSYINLDASAKEKLLEALRALYDDINDYLVHTRAGTVQVFLKEGATLIPATRLSDGTLRYLCLLAILCHPNPPPLVCIEEPELGLHPDVLPTLADLLKDASQRCQLIVTTHSEVLVDAMTDQPESVLVCEKGAGGTSVRRLDPEKLKPWLDDYGLGQFWGRGGIGGTRW